ncbi:ATP-binding protein [Lederbergia wuyishanensis]|uniref:histidine kinase n=1 Tax=Lederbergia wuyishanensis TaxID=1347903 RepID=A0ABU0D8D0_9BACI|nr:ATP-binding protein [Lederbergia wuyishanensis]MCJ8009242.1 ATP-binding protein [Lederbergia wuyishanensis]MDQ0344625.1 two-component system, sporulation sensor kinase D [Lederbergia wuyishanensis]
MLKSNILRLAKKWLIYLMVTLVPSIIISCMLTNQNMENQKSKYKFKAHQSAKIHANNLSNFIGETIGRVEMLATLINTQHDDLNNIYEILKETHEQDDRFSGLYLVDPKGDLVVSSNPLNHYVNVSDRPYFQESIKTGKTTFSETHFGRVTKRFVITVAIPISPDAITKGVLLVSIRLDEVEKSIKSILKDEIIVVTNVDGKTEIETSKPIPNKHYINASADITQLPWTITAKVLNDEAKSFWDSFMFFLVLVLFIMNLLYLLVHYYLLNKKGKKERAQMEHQKIELLGKLAASTAHEIRNPLTGIKGLISLLSEESKDQKAQFYYGVIQNEITRINAIVSELLLLGRPTAYTFEISDANNIVREIEPIIQSETNYMNVGLTIKYSKDELPISCVKDQIKQVLLNLTKNSLHAIEGADGTLSITLEKVDDDCVIQVIDNGKGIPGEKINEVFNPFFTMKEEGSGLGLTVCKKIIDSHNGTIDIHSVVNKGTQVEIRIPIHKSEK